MTEGWQSQLKQWIKRSPLFQPHIGKLRLLYREVRFIADLVRSGKLRLYQRHRASVYELPSQKSLAFVMDLPPLRDFRDLIAWLDVNSIRYLEGGFCIYIPPQDKAQELFGAVLSAYPPNSGLKILKDLKPPSEAIYCSTDANPDSPRISDWISYRPQDYLRVANFLYDEGLGPRVYGLAEIQTPFNSLSAYVVQHVAGTVPSEEEHAAFLQRLRQLCQDQLMPLLTDWETAGDFRCPDCQGNLIRDEATGKTLYVDFQSFLIKDTKQYMLRRAAEVREALHFGNPHWIRGGKYLYQSIPGLAMGKRDVDNRWASFRAALQKQGVSAEGAVVFDVGCNAGMIMYSALTDGAAWAIGWDRPEVVAAAQRLLLSLGATRFDLLGEEISSATDFSFAFPQNENAYRDSILFFLSMRKHIGFPDGIKDLPFEYVVYEDHDGVSMPSVKNYLEEMRDRWGLRVVHIGSHVDGEAQMERVVAILRRD